MNDNTRREVVSGLRSRIEAGEQWHRAMLAAVAEWPLEDEIVDDERFVYLIDGEALDLARVYDRMAMEIEDLVPAGELEDLLVHGKSSSGVSREDMRELMGIDRYKAYLTFIYGVLVEELVVLAVLQDLRRKRRASGLTRYDANLDDAYTCVYGEPRRALLNRFRKERGLPQRRSIDLTGMQEFRYWLFKLRLKTSDKSRVASDTKRALLLLQEYAGARGQMAL
ncbi:MAG: hypothetical protein ACOC9B_02730 [Chloroflexota bacterium]